MKLKLLIILFFTTIFSWGQIYTNSFQGTGSCPTQGNSPTMATNATGTPLSRSTITCNNTANVFNSTTLNNTGALNTASYIEFSITASTGNVLNLTNLTFFRQASNSAPNQLEVRYSTDNFTTFTNWGSAPNSPTAGTNTTWDFADFSTVAGGTITFRFYPYGTTRADGTATVAATTGTFRLDDVIVNGIVTSSQNNYYWNGGNTSANPANGGTGVWSATNAWRTVTNSGTSATWTDNNPAYLEGTAGTITLSGNQSPSSTTVSTSGYTITTSGSSGLTLAGAIALGSNSITFSPISGANLTLSGNITGSGSASSNIFTKSGAGTLTLSGTNSFTGKVNVTNGFIACSGESKFGTNPTSFTADQITLNGGGVLATGGINFNSNRGITLGLNGGTFDTTGGIITLTNVVTGSGSLTKINSGKLLLSASLTYTGNTIVTGGSIELGIQNALSNSSNIVLNGGTFSTGSNVGYSDTVSTLSLSANSTLALGTGNHTLTFANSSSTTWTGSLLTITGWTGTAGASGTSGKIMVGVGGLSTDQLLKISFSGYGGTPIILPTGELVPGVLPEINLKGNNQSITNGNMSPMGTNHTSFGTATIGATTIDRTFTIENLGTASLLLTGSSPFVSISGTNSADFSISQIPSTTIVASGSTTFIVTFSPKATGTRSAILTIANNDSDENAYTFAIEGTGSCDTAIVNTITPTSGPVGTEVTITSSNGLTNNLSGALVSFNSISSTVTQISNTQIKAIVPTGATSGTLLVSNQSSCQSSNVFTIIESVTTSCQGNNFTDDLFISEVTDATYGGLTYIEIYNGTGSSVTLSNYSLQFFANGSASNYSSQTLSGTLANGASYVVAISVTGSLCTTTGGDGSLANLQTTIQGVNFSDTSNSNGHDYIALYRSSTKIDSWGDYMNQTWASTLGIGDRGVDFRRKNTATIPKTSFSLSDWEISDWIGTGSESCNANDYSNIGSFNFLSGTPPTVTVQPQYNFSCKSTSFTVSGTEGFTGSGNTKTLAYQWYVNTPGSNVWTALTNSGVYSGVTTNKLSISNNSGLDNYQFYCQVRENDANCYKASNSVKIVEAQTTTWDGSSWSSGTPTSQMIAVVNSDYNTSLEGSLDVCSLIVNSPSTLTIASDDYANIQTDLTVNNGATLNVLNNGSLVMIDDLGVVTNSGVNRVYKETAPYERYDYTYWSSPMLSTTIGGVLSSWRQDYTFEFKISNFSDLTGPNGTGGPDNYDDNGDDWSRVLQTTIMTPGKGYISMAPTTGSFPTTKEVAFSGTFNNGIVNIPVAVSANVTNDNDDYNLIGNPYPSSIFADDFINYNIGNISGTLYFWTHVGNISASNPGPGIYNFSSDDYAMYNLSGGTRAAINANASSGITAAPTGYIASGQGFFVEVVSNGSLAFKNSMRNKSYTNNQFFRIKDSSCSKPKPKNRLWLNLENGDKMFSQQLIGYFDNATLDFDAGFDGLVSKTQNYFSFYSFLENDSNLSYRIQGRPSFEETDVVKLGYFSAVSGESTISIDQVEGILASAEISIYLEDKYLNIIHDLKQTPYKFQTNIGTYNDRFLLKYKSALLDNDVFDNDNKNFVILNNDNKIDIISKDHTIEKIMIYDTLGRKIFEKEKINNNNYTFDYLDNNQALIIKVYLDDSKIYTRKTVQ